MSQRFAYVAVSRGRCVPRQMNIVCQCEGVDTIEAGRLPVARRPEAIMRMLSLLLLLALIVCAPAKAQDMSPEKRTAALWYEAFNKKDQTILDRILSAQWVDIPAAPDLPAGPEGVKPTLIGLTTTFPDLRLTIKDMLQDGNKVVVRANMTGTQRGVFMGVPSKNRSLNIQVVDIHEIQNGKILRTWHTEDWMTGLRQLGAFEK